MKKKKFGPQGSRTYYSYRSWLAAIEAKHGKHEKGGWVGIPVSNGQNAEVNHICVGFFSFNLNKGWFGLSDHSKSKKENTMKDPKAVKTLKSNPGVIATIIETITKAGKKGASKDQILATLKKAFPDRDEEKMRATINVQVPTRISNERKKLQRTKEGTYRFAA